MRRIDLTILLVMAFCAGIVLGATLAGYWSDERIARDAMLDGETHCVWAVPHER